MTVKLADKLEEMDRRFVDIEGLISDPKVAADRPRLTSLIREHGRLSKVVHQWRDLKSVRNELAEARSILDDPGSDSDLRELAQGEIDELGARDAEIADTIKRSFLTQDEDSSRNAIMEIRAGTGGEEAALFAADLFRMYVRHAEAEGWKTSVLDKHETDLNGFREVTLAIEGDGAFRALRYESGGHRVQRVPVTEAGGRIHTSLCTVAVLAEAEPVEVEIDPGDLEVEFFCASGPGGQKVNKTSSAVRIKHKPTGIVASCQETPSQHKNRAQAMRVLASRVREHVEGRQRDARDEERRTMIGSGDRSQRIRTYNFPQNRLTDHRINFTLYDLENVLLGRLEPVISALTDYEIAQREKDLSFD